MKKTAILTILLFTFVAHSFAADQFQIKYRKLLNEKCTATEETHGRQAPWECNDRLIKRLNKFRSKLIQQLLKNVESKGMESDRKKNIAVAKRYFSSWEKYSAQSEKFADIYYDCGTMCTDFKYFAKVEVLKNHIDVLLEFVRE